MARDWNEYEAKIREEIERKVAQATARAERKAERMRARADRSAQRAHERAEMYAEKVRERAQREAGRVADHFARADRAGWDPFSKFHVRMNQAFGGCDSGKGRHDTEIIIGIAILAIGAGLLLSNLHILPWNVLSRFWPVLLIIMGAMRLSRARFASARGFAFFLVIGGVIMLLGNLNVVHVSWNLFWPAILIVVGLQHLLSNFDPPKAPPAASAAGPGTPPPPSSASGPETPTSGPRATNTTAGYSNPRYSGASAAPPPPPGATGAGPTPSSSGSVEPDVHLHEYCIFTGGKRRIVTNNFRGGEVVAVFGGVEVDLRGSQLGNDEAVIDITAAFGGCNIKVPTNWYVEMRGVAAFGGYSDKTIPPRISPGQRLQKLVVTGSAAFGGVVIEN